jgi:hypothetical protein
MDRSMSDSDVSEKGEAAELHPDLAQLRQKPLATSYLPLWFLLAFAIVIAYGLLTK